MDKRKKNALETAVALLSKNALGKQQLALKLLSKDFSKREVDAALAECERYGYINDKLLTEAKVSFMRDRGDGVRKIQFTLRRKGFHKDVVDSAIQMDEKTSGRSEQDIARALLERKKSMLFREPDPQKRRLKAVRALAVKGFSAGTAYSAVSDFLRNAGSDVPETGSEDFL